MTDRIKQMDTFARKLYKIAHQEISKLNECQQVLVNRNAVDFLVSISCDMLEEGYLNEDECIKRFKKDMNDDTIFNDHY